ncbi:hypothetical protein [Solicola gregarius]|uniref:Transmembrane protein n=1 Tax=Solicola gregarius TaxID=2908642 RepID=A0AA46YKA0_9ACTN|nr:hypothetical protein [Solicola gregarius]UYM05488.1 hypothetical protein L0C25_23760 [Solicola gregarius]UYM05520.1 hypothetical protein L0C25_00060 [Solicola gregarius]
MSNQLMGVVLAAVIPLAIVGASRLTGHWFRTEWLPQDRIEKGYRERKRLLMMADQLAKDGETAWAEEWRRTARSAAVRPLAEMEFAREHPVRSIFLAGVMVAYALFVILGLLGRLLPLLMIPAVIACFVAIVGLVYWVGTVPRARRQIRRRIDQKLSVQRLADADRPVEAHNASSAAVPLEGRDNMRVPGLTSKTATN